MESSKPASAQELLSQGLDLYGIGRVEQAIQSWRQALILEPFNETAKEYLEAASSDLNFDLPTFSPTETQVEESLTGTIQMADPPLFDDDDLEKLSFEELFLKAIEAYCRGDLSDSEGMLLKCQERQPDDPWVQHNLNRLRR